VPEPIFRSDWLTDPPYDDVHLGVLKAGKESEVHLLARVGATRTSLIAEKRFKARDRRAFRDDMTYRGVWATTVRRGVDVAGPRREQRAMRKGTRFGREAIHRSWIGHEWTTLVQLYDAGVTVPPPVEPTGEGYRMAFIGDDRRAAPRLTDVRFDRREAGRAWLLLRDEIARMLDADVVHGDLSAYNVLWWRERPVIIDLSQAVDAITHPAARELLARDVARTAAHFRRLGVAVDMSQTLAEVGDSPARFARQVLSS
jgi:RIO kinase 1